MVIRAAAVGLRAITGAQEAQHIGTQSGGNTDIHPVTIDQNLHTTSAVVVLPPARNVSASAASSAVRANAVLRIPAPSRMSHYMRYPSRISRTSQPDKRVISSAACIPAFSIYMEAPGLFSAAAPSPIAIGSVFRLICNVWIYS